MKIGIYINAFNPKLGGSYTIEHEMLNALLLKFGGTTYSPVIFSEHELDIPGVKCVNLKTSGFNRLRFKLKKQLHHFSYLFKNPGQEFQNTYKKETIEASGIDFFIYLTPMVDFRINIPYLTMLWDLQHRLQPYFPEVSTLDEFDGREQIYNRKLKRASYIICGTETGKKEVIQFYGVSPARVKVIPFSTPQFALIADKHPSTGIKKKYGIRDNYLFYPAQFWPHKNHINLITALKTLVKEKKYDIDLVLIGSDKGNKAFIENYVVANGLSDYVKFPGFVSEQELVEFYRESRALTFVSQFGPDNLPPLEAFAIGCPVIASDVAGATEQLGDAAIIIDTKIPANIAEAIEMLLNHNEKREMLISRGKERAQLYKSDHFAKGVTEILDEFMQIRRCWGQGSGRWS